MVKRSSCDKAIVLMLLLLGGRVWCFGVGQLGEVRKRKTGSAVQLAEHGQPYDGLYESAERAGPTFLSDRNCQLTGNTNQWT